MSDTTAPELISLTLPMTIDLSMGSKTMHVAVEGLDHTGGTGVDHVLLIFDKNLVTQYGISNVFIVGQALFGGDDDFGDTTPNVASANLTLSVATAPGIYHVAAAYIYDKVGNEAIYDGQHLTQMGINTTFVITGGLTDITAPTLTKLKLSDVIDVSSGTQVMHVDVEGEDSAGGTGIDHVLLIFDRNLVTQHSISNVFIVGQASFAGADVFGDGTPNSAGSDIALSTANAPGIYHVAAAYIYDKAGNEAIYSSEQLTQLGINTTFTVIGGINDRMAPTLTKLTLPAVVDVSKGNQAMHIVIEGADNTGGTGVDHVLLIFDKNLVTQYGISNVFIVGQSISAGDDNFDDATPNVASADITVDSVSAPGTYHVAAAYVYDKAGNEATYSAEQLMQMGINTSFVVSDGKAASLPTSTVTAVVANDKITLMLSSSDWTSASNKISLSMKYDSNAMHFLNASLLGDGVSSFSVSDSETAGAGILTLTGVGSTGELGKAFLGLAFRSSVPAGSSEYAINNFSLNGMLQTMGSSQSGFVSHGSTGSDHLVGGTGNGYVDGGTGLDTLSYTLASKNYTIGHSAGIFSLIDQTGAEITLLNVERLNFSDKSFALDIDGNGGQAYRIYQAALGRVPDGAGLGYWMAQMDKGITLQEVANGFIHSAEFVALYGGDNPSQNDFINKLYSNILHRAPEQAGFNYWLGAMQTGVSNEDVLVAFSESTENHAQVIGSIQNGFEYIPFV